MDRNESLTKGLDILKFTFMKGPVKIDEAIFDIVTRSVAQKIVLNHEELKDAVESTVKECQECLQEAVDNMIKTYEEYDKEEGKNENKPD